jgi:hypothetical protein
MNRVTSAIAGFAPEGSKNSKTKELCAKAHSLEIGNKWQIRVETQ